MNTLPRIAFWTVRVGLFLTLLAPFLVFRDTVQLYLIGKVTIFQIIIEIIFPFFLYLAFTDKKYRPKFNLIYCALGAYFAAVILSAIFGVNPARSFWGYRDRMDGIFAMLHFLAFFVMLTGMFKGRKDRFWFLNAVFLCGLGVAADYIARFTAADIAAGAFGLPRVEGVLGNVIFFASFILFQIFVAAILFFYAENKKLKILYASGAVLFSVVVFLSLTRGAILALLAGALIAGIWSAFRRGGRWKIGVAAGVLFLVAVGIIGWSVRDTKPFSDMPALSRILHTSPFTGTGETRLLAWQAAWSGFLERPVLGWGYVNFYAPFDKNYNPEFLRYSPNETWFDRAHNIIFENLATGGVIVSAAYLALLGAALFVSIKKKDGPGGLPAVGYRLAGLGIAVYFIQNLFAVDHFGSYLLFFIFLGVLAAETDTTESRKFKLSGLGLVAVILAGVCGAYFVYNINYKTLFLSQREFAAILASSENIDNSLTLYWEAFAVETPYAAEAKISFVKSIAGGIERNIFNDADKRKVLETAKNELDDATLKYGWNSAYDAYAIGRIFGEWGKYEPGYFKEAGDYLNRAVELSPRRQQMYFGVGRFKGLEGDVPGAVAAFQKMIDLDPAAAWSHWYAGIEYNNLGLPEAADEIIAAYRLGFSPRDKTEAQMIIAAMKYKKDLKDLPEVYLVWAGFDPQNAGIFAELAALYAQLGEKEKARVAAERAMSLDPSFVKEGKIFLKSLGY